jgi:hypothetical protein
MAALGLFKINIRHARASHRLRDLRLVAAN